MSIDVKRDKEEHVSVVKELQELGAQFRSEGYQPTAEDNQKYDRLIAREEQLRSNIDKGERLARIESIQPAQTTPSQPVTRSYAAGQTNQPATFKDDCDALRGWLLEGTDMQKEGRYRHTANYSKIAERLGVDVSSKEYEFRLNNWQPQFRTAQTVGTLANGGYLVEQDQSFMASIRAAEIQYNSVEQWVTPLQTSGGNPIPFNVTDDTANRGRWIGEGASLSPANQETFSQITLGAYKLTSDPVLFSAEIIQDAAVNLLDYVSAKIGERMGKSKSDKYTNGAGSTECTGLATAAAVGVTCASTTAFTYAELVRMMTSIDPIFWQDPRSAWYVSPAFYIALMQMVDGNQRPLLNSSLSGIATGFDFTLLGRPVRILNNLGTLAAGNTVAIFGVIENHFVIRNAGPTRLKRLEELYAGNDQVAVVAFSRHDSNYVGASTSHPFRKMVMAAS